MIWARSLLRYKALAAIVMAAALLLRIAVPAGFMPDASSGHVVISICSGYGPMTMAMPIKGKSDGGHHDKSDMPCGFGNLSAHGLTGADPVLLAQALLFVVLAALFTVTRLAPVRRARVRPPLRGPPPIS